MIDFIKCIRVFINARARERIARSTPRCAVRCAVVYYFYSLIIYFNIRAVLGLGFLVWLYYSRFFRVSTHFHPR